MSDYKAEELVPGSPSVYLIDYDPLEESTHAIENVLSRADEADGVIYDSATRHASLEKLCESADLFLTSGSHNHVTDLERRWRQKKEYLEDPEGSVVLIEQGVGVSMSLDPERTRGYLDAISTAARENPNVEVHHLANVDAVEEQMIEREGGKLLSDERSDYFDTLYRKIQKSTSEPL